MDTIESELIAELLMARAKRLMEKNEPELATIVKGWPNKTPSDIERAIRSVTGRRDTGRLAYWLAFAYAAEGEALTNGLRSGLRESGRLESAGEDCDGGIGS